MNEESTINGFLTRSGPINLRHTERKPDTAHDMAAASGLLFAVLVGLNVIVWGYVAWLW